MDIFKMIKSNEPSRRTKRIIERLCAELEKESGKRIVVQYFENTNGKVVRVRDSETTKTLFSVNFGADSKRGPTVRIFNSEYQEKINGTINKIFRSRHYRILSL